MGFHPGDQVLVANFGKAVVREVRNGGSYLVELKGRSMVVAESQITAAEGRKPRTRGIMPPPDTDVPEHLARQHAATSLDLHGKTMDEAVAALDAFLDAAILAGHTEVRIIHGRSGGRLRAAVHARLKMVPSARNFRVDPTNAGVTIVVF